MLEGTPLLAYLFCAVPTVLLLAASLGQVPKGKQLEGRILLFFFNEQENSFSTKAVI